MKKVLVVAAIFFLFFNRSYAEKSHQNGWQLLWKVPTYLVVGAPRDLVDLPLSGLVDLFARGAQYGELKMTESRHQKNFGLLEKRQNPPNYDLDITKPVSYLILYTLAPLDYVLCRSFVSDTGILTSPLKGIPPPKYFPNFHSFFGSRK